MDFRQLEMLLAVVERGGYVQAGAHLHVSHSAIHRQVRLLEGELNERILVRSGKRVQPTDAGRILLDLARRLQWEIASAVRQVSDSAQLQSGHVRIGTGTTMLLFFLPPVLEAFRAAFPRVEVYVTTDTATRVAEDVQGGALDLGIVFAPGSAPSGGRPMVYERLYREEFVFVVAKGHPLAAMRKLSIAQLQDFPFIAYSRRSRIRALVEELFARAGVAPKIAMELENEEAAEKMIGIDMGVALLSRRRAVADNVHCLDIAGRPIYADVNMVTLQGEYLPAPVRVFAEMCRWASRNPGGRPDVGRLLASTARKQRLAGAAPDLRKP